MTLLRERKGERGEGCSRRAMEPPGGGRAGSRGGGVTCRTGRGHGGRRPSAAAHLLRAPRRAPLQERLSRLCSRARDTCGARTGGAGWWAPCWSGEGREIMEPGGNRTHDQTMTTYSYTDSLPNCQLRCSLVLKQPFWSGGGTRAASVGAAAAKNGARRLPRVLRPRGRRKVGIEPTTNR